MNLSSSKNFIHPLARDYFNRIQAAGGDVYDKASVNNFVNAISRIVPQNSWICWPLRSIHNIGTGTSMFSVGGLRPATGTIVNAPLWNNNGITFASSSDAINLGFDITGGIAPFTIAIIAKPVSGTNFQFGVGAQSGTNNRVIVHFEAAGAEAGSYTARNNVAYIARNSGTLWTLGTWYRNIITQTNDTVGTWLLNGVLSGLSATGGTWNSGSNPLPRIGWDSNTTGSVTCAAVVIVYGLCPQQLDKILATTLGAGLF